MQQRRDAAVGRKTGAYISAGLTLFVLTFIVNAAARAVVSGKAN